MNNTYFIKSQNGGLGVIEHMGYNMAKHGVVALTKGFKFAEPTVYDTEGIKCYALAPYYVDTNLVSNRFMYYVLSQDHYDRLSLWSRPLNPNSAVQISNGYLLNSCPNW